MKWRNWRFPAKMDQKIRQIEENTSQMSRILRDISFLKVTREKNFKKTKIRLWAKKLVKLKEALHCYAAKETIWRFFFRIFTSFSTGCFKIAIWHKNRQIWPPMKLVSELFLVVPSISRIFLLEASKLQFGTKVVKFGHRWS